MAINNFVRPGDQLLCIRLRVCMRVCAHAYICMCANEYFASPRFRAGGTFFPVLSLPRTEGEGRNHRLSTCSMSIVLFDESVSAN